MFLRLHKALLLLVAAILLLTGCAGNFSEDEIAYKINDTAKYQQTDTPIVNPYIGAVADATNIDSVGDNSLVHITVTFEELQPVNGSSYDFAAIDAKNNVDYWKKQGKHAVLRFVCDIPSTDVHSDLPEWLMTITNDGSFYDTSIGKGYSPNYSNELLIKQHKKAIAALANHYDDGFVSYVEIGSVGHWGEWHVKNNEGVLNLPLADVRQRYIAHYVQEFKNAKLIMPEPFGSAKGYEMGLFNLNLGSAYDSENWNTRVEQGGMYSQTEEEKGLSSMLDFWEKSPAAAHLSRTVSAQSAFIDLLEQTVEELKEEHTSYIKGVPASAEYKNAINTIRSTVGYKFGINKITVMQRENFEHIEIKLNWENFGIAPLYFDAPVNLYIKNEFGDFEQISDISINLKELMPGKKELTSTIVQESIISDSDALYLGITDPYTNQPAINLVTNQPNENGYIEIYRFKK